MWPRLSISSRTSPTRSALVAQRSTKIARAPSSTFFSSSKPSHTYAVAAEVASVEGASISASTSASIPASRATSALVLRRFLNGKYKSSRRAFVSQARIKTRRSSVSFPCSSIAARMLCLRSSNSRRYAKRSSNWRSCESSRPPVTSLRYRAINGTVFPSSNNATVAATWLSDTPSSRAIVELII